MSHHEYEALRGGAQVLSRDEHGDKVLRTPDHRIIKLFRRKRLISSALLDPYALRFARAARKLKTLGIPAPDVLAVHRIRSIKRHAVIYREMDGVNLRTALESDQSKTSELLTRLAGFMALLHRHGVYFRAIHFGNVFVCQNGEFGLIDVSEAKFTRRALSPALRARNFKPLCSYAEDREALSRFGVERFLGEYLGRATMSPGAARAFLDRLPRVRPMYATAAASVRGRSPSHSAASA